MKINLLLLYLIISIFLSLNICFFKRKYRAKYSFISKSVDGSVSIVEIMRHYGAQLSPTTKLAEFITLCPFHDDHKPSLSVNDEKGVYYCFSCQAKGGILQYVMDIEGITNPDEAKSRLSDITGLNCSMSSYREQIDQ